MAAVSTLNSRTDKEDYYFNNSLPSKTTDQPSRPTNSHSANKIKTHPSEKEDQLSNLNPRRWMMIWHEIRN